MEQHTFRNIDLADPFFNSLKEDYPEFSDWYEKKAKAGEKAFIQKDDDGLLQGFLYMKNETEALNDINPPMPAANRLKVGTFKIDAHNTKLGEYFVKKVMLAALFINAQEIYVTIYPKHEGLINLLKRYGFVEYGTKGEDDKPELVFVKSMEHFVGNLLLDYPFVHIDGQRKFVLSVNPEYHTQLFPDSILNNEERTKDVLVRDVTHTNSIHQIYLSCMKGLDSLRRGDVLLIYRTSDKLGPAKYRSVITSLCVVEETKTAKDFMSMDTFLEYANAYSIFDETELKSWYKKKDMVAIKMTYNVAFDRRVVRNELISEVGIDSDYWGFFEITDAQFKDIILRGKINESLIID